MKRSRLVLVKMMENGKYNEDHPNLCLRGLECKTKEGRRRRNLHRNAAIDAVLEEQDYQFQRGVQETDAIAHISEMYTQQSRLQAQQRGHCDAQAAQAL
jgi:hypothetical protein